MSPDGSGCSPPSSTSLPDGIWFGTLKAVDTSAGTVGLDLACWFGGDAANKAAAADGSSEIPVPNDYYIRDKVHTIYTLHASPKVKVLELKNLPDWGAPTTGIAGAAKLLGDFPDRALVWVQVTDGWVVVVQQQYVP